MNHAPEEAPNTQIKTFVESLPVVPLTDLTEDERDCPICRDRSYSSQDGEHPARLACNHVVGKDCLLVWLEVSLPKFFSMHHHCPICRAVLMEPDHDLQVEDLERVMVRLVDSDRPAELNESALPHGEEDICRGLEQGVETTELINPEWRWNQWHQAIQGSD